jgi:hypothetical protein
VDQVAATLILQSFLDENTGIRDQRSGIRQEPMQD